MKLFFVLLCAAALLLPSCALLTAPAWQPPLVLTDSTRTVIIAKNYYGGSYKDRSDHRGAAGGTFVAKAKAPVASGAAQAQDYTRAGQHGGALATAPGASAGATTRTGLPPWALVAGLVVLLLLVLAGLAYRFRAGLAKLLKITV